MPNGAKETPVRGGLSLTPCFSRVRRDRGETSTVLTVFLPIRIIPWLDSAIGPESSMGRGIYFMSRGLSQLATLLKGKAAVGEIPVEL